MSADSVEKSLASRFGSILTRLSVLAATTLLLAPAAIPAQSTYTFSTFAGPGAASSHVDATATAASFNAPAGMAVDSRGNFYVADSANGDGKTDLVWENSATGDRAIWLMNNATARSSPYLTFIDPVWRIAP